MPSKRSKKKQSKSEPTNDPPGGLPLEEIEPALEPAVEEEEDDVESDDESSKKKKKKNKKKKKKSDDDDDDDEKKKKKKKKKDKKKEKKKKKSSKQSSRKEEEEDEESEDDEKEVKVATRKKKVSEEEEDEEKASAPEGPILLSANSIGALFGTLDNSYRDVGSDVGQPFLIDGDALLMDLLCDPLLNRRHGGQTLHFVYCLERRVRQLMEGGRYFFVVFFDCLEGIWQNPEHLLIRRIMQQHLREKCGIKVRHQANWWEDFVDTFLYDSDPSFYLLNSGEPPQWLAEQLHPSTPTLLKSFILYILSNGVRVVRSTEVTFQCNVMMGFLQVCNSKKAMARLQGCQVDPLLVPPAPELDEADDALLGRVQSLLGDANLATQLNVYGVVQFLRAHKADNRVRPFSLETAKLILIHAAMLPQLPLRSRSHTVTITDLDTSRTISEFLSFLPSVLDIETQEFVGDLFDGRLVFKLLDLMREDSDLGNRDGDGIPEDVMEFLETAWPFVMKETGVQVKTAKGSMAPPLLPILYFSKKDGEPKPRVLTPVDLAHDPESREQDIDLPATVKNFVSVDNSLINHLVGDLEKKFTRKKYCRSGVSADLDFFESKVYNDWFIKHKFKKDIIFPDGLDEVKEEKKRLTRRAKRNAQKQKSIMQTVMAKYADSIRGGVRTLRDLKVPDDVKEDAKLQAIMDAKEAAEDEKEKKKKKKKHMKGKKSSALDIEETKRATAAKQRQQKIDAVKRHIKVAETDTRFKTLEQRIKYLDGVIQQLSAPYLAVFSNLILIKWCMEAHKVRVNKENMEPAVRVWMLVNDMFRRFKRDLKPEEIQELQSHVLMLGFTEHAKKMVDEYLRLPLDWSEFKMQRNEVLVDPSTVTRTYQVGTDCERFQMQHAGHVMLRNVDSAPDPRVPSYYPDKWQRDLLDVVDNNNSCLVVAPTSSGKTYVSYYAMKNVLEKNKQAKKSSEQGKIIYVSPNKALLMQASGDVYARFGQVYGMYYFDFPPYRLWECDVLITVPTCLEYLLLSAEREDWAQKIEYVIFDEIHCIGDMEGSTWEHLLMMLKSPFLALSATVGNPGALEEWLRLIQVQRGREMIKIVHPTRWSDLEKSMYLPVGELVDPMNQMDPDEPSHLMSLTKQDPRSRVTSPLLTMHPTAALSNMIRSTGAVEAFPNNLNFAPKDSLILFDSMYEELDNLPAAQQAELRALDVTEFYKVEMKNTRELCIDKQNTMVFERKLKAQLVSWSNAGLNEEVARVMQRINSPLEERIKTMEATSGRREAYGRDFLLAHIYPLLKELYHSGKLPVIVFCFDHDVCEMIVEGLVTLLEDLQEKARKLDGSAERDEIQARLWEKQEKQKKRTEKRKDESASSNKLTGEDKEAAKQELLNDRAASQGEQSNLLGPPPEYLVDPRFSFIKDYEKMAEEEMKWWKDRMLKKTGWPKNHFLVRSLERGIGVHHDVGIKKTYCDMVETMFRQRHLKVVVATETLALGVNMPCKTAVFAMDHHSLTPLQYRQMSGRAGRRGFDNVGHVVFCAVPPRKVFRLMSAPLNSLQGHLSLNSTLPLQMVSYFNHIKPRNRAAVAHQLQGLLTAPFCYTRESVMGKPTEDIPGERHLHEQNKHLFRFSVEFLRREHLLDVAGTDRGFAGLVRHLAEFEPANFVFVNLIQSGILYHTCEDFYARKEETSIKLMTLLSHFFMLKPLPRDFKRDENARGTVVLPPLADLSSRTVQLVKRYNQKTIRLLARSLQMFCETELEHDLSDNTLPISGVDVGPKRQVKQSKSAAKAADAAASAAENAQEVKQKAKKSASKAKAGEDVLESWDGSASESSDSEEDKPEEEEKKSASSDDEESDEEEEEDLAQLLSSDAKKFISVSPFVAVSGQGDDFGSSRLLVDSARSGISLESQLIPLVELKDVLARDLPLNSAALDFYIHGQFSLLMSENRLGNNEAWLLLKKWTALFYVLTEALKTLSTVELDVPVANFVLAKHIAPWKKRERAKAEKQEREYKIRRDRAERGGEAGVVVDCFQYLNKRFVERWQGMDAVRGRGAGGEAMEEALANLEEFANDMEE